MKKSILLCITTMMLLCCVSCSTRKTVPVTQNTTTNPFGEVFESPCAVYDTPTEFAAVGIYRGSMYQKGEVHAYALQNAQSIVRQKMQHAYHGMISDYSNTTGNNRGNDISVKISKAGDQIIDVIVNNTSESCLKWSGVGEDGMVECYVAIQISKEETASQITKKVKDVLTEDEKMKIGFEEEQYRKNMQARFKEYKENK